MPPVNPAPLLSTACARAQAAQPDQGAAAAPQAAPATPRPHPLRRAANALSSGFGVAAQPRSAAPGVLSEHAKKQQLRRDIHAWATAQVGWRHSFALATQFKNALGLGDQAPSTRIDVPKSQLTGLHESLGNAQALITLSAYSNRLTSLPESLGNAQTLITLSVYNNQLTSLPESLSNARALTTLLAQDNRLTSLPESIYRLRRLKFINLQNNRFTSIPPQLLELPSDCVIDFSGNPLSDEVLADMHALLEERAAQGLSAPHIDFNGHIAGESGVWNEQSDLAQARPLAQAMEAWYPPDGDSLPPAVNVDDDEATNGLSRLLDRLPGSAEFRNAATQPGLQQRVRALLQAVASSPELLASCNAAAVEGLGECGDRVALTFDNLELQVRLHRDKAPSALLVLGAGAHRRQVLQDVARAKVKTMRMVDEIEVHLAFQTEFGERVLCGVQGMLHRRYAFLKPVDMERAKAALDQSDKPKNAAQRCEFLAQWAPWRHHLQVTHKSQFKAVNASFADQLEALLDPKRNPQFKKMTPDQLNEAAKAIRNTQTVALHQLATALTRAVVVAG
jgi:hypothetical protein